mgnify:FL=1
MFKAIKSKAMLAVLPAAMICAIAAPASAETVPTVFTGEAGSAVNIPIVKVLQLPEGASVPTETFTFTLEAVTEDAPTATVAMPDFSGNDSSVESENGICLVKKSANIGFDGDFPHAGIYEYEVTEVQGATEGMTYSADSYTLRLYVANAADGSLYIKNVTAEHGGEKAEDVSFVNTYTKNSSLEISKTTVGDYADKTRKFEFSITFDRIGMGNEDATVTGNLDNGGQLVCKVDKAMTFELADGEKLVFDSLPVGTRYTVTETAAEDGYVPSVQVVENGVEGGVRTAADADALASAEDGATNLVGEGTNSVAFTNTQNDVPLTGILLKNAPFVVAIAAGALLLIGFVVRSVRRGARR